MLIQNGRAVSQSAQHLPDNLLFHISVAHERVIAERLCSFL